MLAPNTPPRILMVDDEPDTLQLIRKILEADGYDIHQAANGVEALKYIQSHWPDLVLLDVVMPEMDGMAVLRELRRLDATAGVIMVSALSSENLVVQAMMDGADDFVNKPFALKNIRVRIRQVLDKSRLRRENVLLQEELRLAHDKIRALFGQYMAGPVVERLLASPTLPSLGGERQITTVLFMDFCEFTSLAHAMEPDQVVQLLNEHFSLVIRAILAEEGTLDKVLGDGVMALFNAPAPQSDHALRAVRSAVTIRDAVLARQAEGQPTLRVRIGIHTGESVVGNVGAQEFMNYTAIGDTVNVAKRLQEQAEENTIVVSADTAALLPPSVRQTALGPWTVKGRQAPVEVHRIDAWQ